MLTQTVTTRSEAETEAIGERLGAALEPGSVLLLHGDLGAGKTTLVRGIVRGLGVDPDEVSSPTFVLVNEYRGRLTLHHVDLYRLEGDAVDDLGVDQLGEGEDAVVIEWAERLPRPIAGATIVRIADRGGNTREITIEPADGGGR